MEFAPVIIPTLNRDVHLRRCLDSLAANTGTEHTELYISVDFPPHERYRPGYERVKALLEGYDFSMFRKVHIFYQEKNLGPGGNYAFLQDAVRGAYSGYIFSEDDNEFSPNFLDYMHKCMEFYRDDPKVLSVCASRDTDWELNGEPVGFSRLNASYGIGIWFQKRRQEEAEGVNILLPDKLYGPSVMWRLYRQNRCLCCMYILDVLGTDRGLFWKDPEHLYWCDSLHSLYMHLTDRVCVVPALAKARTWGNDGSGVNMAKQDFDPEAKWPLDTAREFDASQLPAPVFDSRNDQLGDTYMPHSRKQGLLALLVYGILMLHPTDRRRGAACVQKLRAAMKKSK